MIVAGIDVGGKNVHIVIKKDGQIIGKGTSPTGIKKAEAAEALYEQVLKQAGLTRKDVERVVATGSAAKRVAFANGSIADAAADARGVIKLFPNARTVINVGLLCTGPIIPMSYSLGKKKTLEMLLSGDMIDAKEAERLGLVNKVAPAEKLEEETFAFAQKLINKSPIAIRMGKNFYYQMIDMPFRQRFILNSEIMTRLATTEDACEGISAFIEKRQPKWKGK